MNVKAPVVTPEDLWRAHRAALGGKSAVTGAPLPAQLDECPPGVQGSHWGMSLAVAYELGAPEPSPPAAVSLDEQERIRRAVLAVRPG